jgi:hypothetical protein
MHFFRNLFKKPSLDVSHGLIPSPPDENDYALSSVSPIIQRYPVVCPRPFDLEILNQGTEPSCVGQACAGMKQYLELKEKISKTFDGSWIYKECKKIDGRPDIRGTYFRIGLKVLKNTGALPVGESDPAPYKIKLYARVDDNSFEGLKKAIFLHGVVMAGFYGSNAGWGSEIIRPPRKYEKKWGHATFLTSYEKDYLIGQNSWGEDRHKNGLFKVPSTYLPFESWVVVLDAPTTPTPTPIKTGWVAVNWILEWNGTWRTFANLNVRDVPGIPSKILKTLYSGTVFQITNSPRVSADGYVWQEIII